MYVHDWTSIAQLLTRDIMFDHSFEFSATLAYLLVSTYPNISVFLSGPVPNVQSLSPRGPTSHVAASSLQRRWADERKTPDCCRQVTAGELLPPCRLWNWEFEKEWLCYWRMKIQLQIHFVFSIYILWLTTFRTIVGCRSPYMQVRVCKVDPSPWLGVWARAVAMAGKALVFESLALLCT